MNKIKAAALAAAVGAAMAFPTVSMAQMNLKGPDSGWYVGGHIGQSDIDEIGEKDTAFRILGGYQINKNFGAELGYTDFGKSESGGITFKGNAIELTAVGTLPINNQFSVYGKLGFAMTEGEASALGVSRSEDSVTPTYGVGVQYNFSPTLGLRGEWQRYDVGDDPIQSDVDVLSIGVIFRFK